MWTLVKKRNRSICKEVLGTKWKDEQIEDAENSEFTLFHLFLEMRKSIIFVLFVLFACVWGQYYYSNANYNTNANKVLLSSVQTLTFSKSKYTTGRRSRFASNVGFHSRPIPQMTCERGSASCSYAPSSMQCYNRGFDGRDVQVDFFE